MTGERERVWADGMTQTATIILHACVPRQKERDRDMTLGLGSR
jgi:hypothetical protein